MSRTRTIPARSGSLTKNRNFVVLHSAILCVGNGSGEAEEECPEHHTQSMHFSYVLASHRRPITIASGHYRYNAICYQFAGSWSPSSTLAKEVAIVCGDQKDGSVLVFARNESSFWQISQLLTSYTFSLPPLAVLSKGRET